MGQDSNDRRNFLGKLVLGTTALAAAPIIGASPLQNTTPTMNAIKKIRALGFQWQTLDPFLFCVHHEDDYPKGNDELGPNESLAGRNIGSDFNIKDGYRMYHGTKVPGFPGHPHRGFETLTVVRKGLVDHSDSLGGAGRYGNGDLQWMTAGKGLMHSEMFPLLKKEERNPLELFQIWMNLPRKSKMVSPDYKMFWSEEIPKIKQQDGKVFIEVLVGSLFNEQAPSPPSNSWANESLNCVGVYNLILAPNTTFILPATKEGINRSLYFYEGEALIVANQNVPEYHAVDIESNLDIAIKTGATEVKILILQGRPIDEPVVQHGPFVMNSRQEINEAFAEYQRTQFGGWPWSNYDHVHDKKLGRFAKYPNGKEEVKG
jgi:redox-sensitive bicupin YhaK (pirin superfamily)